MKDVSVIGAGRFGLFWGRQLSHHVQVTMWDKNPDLQSDVEHFASWDNLTECLSKEIIFLTVPIRHIEAFLTRYKKDFVSGSVIVDCSSVKLVVENWFERILADDINWMATHPLFGPDSAELSVRGKNLAITSARVDRVQLDEILFLFQQKLGLQILNMDADEHDRLMAYNLSLMHHVGRALHRLGVTELELQMAHIKRICQTIKTVMNDNVSLFEDFNRFNPYSKAVKQDFLTCFQEVDDRVIQAEDHRISNEDRIKSALEVPMFHGTELTLNHKI